MKFKNKVALVTGSSRGLGREIARGFAREGASVVINYNSSEKQAQELGKTLEENGTQCLVIKADVGNIAEVEAMFEEVMAHFRRVDILVNNAGLYHDSPVWKMDMDVWEDVLKTDLTSVFNCTKFATKFMRQQEFGRIINISSVIGQVGSFGTSNYAAAKAGIFGFSKSVAREVARKNITINSLALGFIEIGMLLKLSAEIRETILKQIPMKRWGKPLEVVETILFLASKEAGYITGQVISINGGYYL